MVKKRRHYQSSLCWLILSELLFLSSAFANEGPFFKSIPLQKEAWIQHYDGYGFIHFFGDSIEIAPKEAGPSPDKTHAALLLSKKKLPSYGYEIEVDFLLANQLRAHPNPWETFWLFFQYRSEAQAKKKTNYIMVKTNGVEAGKAWNTADQSFLFTSNKPVLRVGEKNSLRVSVGKRIVYFSYNGEKIGELPRRLLFRHPGHLGLYTEDASIVIYSVKTRAYPELRPKKVLH